MKEKFVAGFVYTLGALAALVAAAVIMDLLALIFLRAVA